jgi:hypothetical protein
LLRRRHRDVHEDHEARFEVHGHRQHDGGFGNRDVAGLTSRKLLSSGGADGLLYGPRSPKYGTD